MTLSDIRMGNCLTLQCDVDRHRSETFLVQHCDVVKHHRVTLPDGQLHGDVHHCVTMLDIIVRRCHPSKCGDGKHHHVAKSNVSVLNIPL